MLRVTCLIAALLITSPLAAQGIDQVAAQVMEAMHRLDETEAPESVKVRARVLMLDSQFAGALSDSLVRRAQAVIEQSRWEWTLGGVTRGNASQKRIALIFTGGEFGEGTDHILNTLASREVHASFFVTGAFTSQPGLHASLNRMVAEKHYLGPHSQAHLLYAPWEDRSQSLVTQQEFTIDLMSNIETLKWFGAAREGDPIYFIPPYEWYNEEHANWAEQMGVLLFNFTTGSGSNRDFAPEGHRSFVPSRQILDDILAFEAAEEENLNGFLLLLHLGSGRDDPMHPLVGKLIDTLSGRGYEFVRIDEMLPPGAWRQR